MIDRVILDKAIGIVSLIIIGLWIIESIIGIIKDGYKFFKEKGLKKLFINCISHILLAFILIGIVFGIPVCIIYIILKFIS